GRDLYNHRIQRYPNCGFVGKCQQVQSCWQERPAIWNARPCHHWATFLPLCTCTLSAKQEAKSTLALGDLYCLWGGKVSGQLDYGRIDIYTSGFPYTLCFDIGSPGLWTVDACRFSAFGG